jgi:hypothetical protein
MSLLVVAAIAALIVLVMAISGSRVARQWTIAMYSLLAVVLIATWYFYS